MSTNPGARISQVASRPRAAEPVRLPRAVIRPPLIPMSPLKAGIRVPSTIVPFLISSSYSGMVETPLWLDRQNCGSFTSAIVSNSTYPPLPPRPPNQWAGRPRLTQRRSLALSPGGPQDESDIGKKWMGSFEFRGRTFDRFDPADDSDSQQPSVSLSFLTQMRTTR